MDFKESFKKDLFNISDQNFNDKAILLFKYQAKHNPIYKQYIDLLGKDPDKVSLIEEIPFLPILFFKTQEIKTGSFSEKQIFYSSGTTGLQTSRHHVADPEFYLKNCEKIFKKFYGNLSDFIVLALLPSYQQNPGSSLIYMVNHFIKQSGNSLSGFVTENTLLENLEKYKESPSKKLLIGVSYALWDLAENEHPDLSDFIVMETGGMKGRREELVRDELHQILKSGLNIRDVHSEYGMTELLSQAYSSGSGFFLGPDWFKILLRDINDPLTIGSGRSSGGINIIDLANVDSCAFIETQDLGKISDDKNFEVLGRFDNSDIRGCNLLYMS
ncbi:MAG: acyl transferase [Sporocytophaga sp.]|uniref:acyl transferase n=1 Tax=Sporocytophaga sp. TaxID=2231183 RepID=UPI001B2F8079|nr:acyl transferase [Sporocytophaga sp.]MBO9701159.1 acyl transferase [Sporocytophaga sp.]